MDKNFGGIFSEGIFSTSKRRIHQKHDGDQGVQFTRSFTFLIAGFLLLFLLLFFRLFLLTLIEGGRFRALSAGNRVREEVIAAPRGVIYDRNGVALVQNIPVFIDSFGHHFFEIKPATISGSIKTTVARSYPFGDATAHVIGYTGEATAEELHPDGPISGEIVGKAGVEKSYDIRVHGKAGKELIEVDALGDVIRKLGKVDPIPGKSLTLSIDVRLQKIAKDALGNAKGAVIATNPKTGEVYLLFSSPSFDPNVFITGKNLDAVFQNLDLPLFDRAVAGQYPPGSTFKIVTALAALSSGTITADTEIEDTGVLQVGAFSFGNWYFSQYGKKEGMVSIVKALKRSNDIFFYKVGELLGIEKLSAFAKKVGLGSKTGIDIAGEMSGLMPDPEWVQKERGQGWYLGNTYHVAIGQGDILATPLQINAWTNIVANGGKLCRPHVLKSALVDCRDLQIDSKIIALVAEGMKEACAPGGTGWPLFNFKIQNSKIKIDNVNYFETLESTTSGKPMVGVTTACKTGTSEFGDPKNRTHALFTVFAPVADPQISITVVVEAAGEGSNVAAPVAKKILEGWFGEKQ